MKKHTKIILSLAIIYSMGLACSQPESECITPTELGIKPINPNGDSELALLMRAMFAEAQTIRQDIETGKPVQTRLCYEQLLTATPTQAHQVKSTAYQTYARTYLQTIEHLNAADPAHQLALYQRLVGNCMACHQSMCPGPIAKIKKLL
ncbi:MAG: hypothetical protein AAGH79_10535 [Bacteroidota bacterium]